MKKLCHLWIYNKLGPPNDFEETTCRSLNQASTGKRQSAYKSAITFLLTPITLRLTQCNKA